MSNRKDTGVVENGVTFGIVALALMVIFGVGLAKWDKEPAAPAAAEANSTPITLPLTLSGDYSATAPDANTAKQIAALESNAKTALSNLPGASAWRLYLHQSTVNGAKGVDKFFLAQAFRADGGAFSPPLLGLDNTATITKVGDAICYASTSSGSTVSQCERSGNGVTVMVASPVSEVSSTVLAPYADEIFNSIK